MSWKNPPTRFTKTVEKDVESVGKRIALKILRFLTFTSPVDSGRFRANWLVGIAHKISSTVNSKDKLGSNTFAKGKQVLARKKRLATIFISNNLPYARRLNEGSSSQAPRNFVQQGIKEALK